MTKLPDDLQLFGDEAHEVATEVVISAITAFRAKTLMNPDPAKRWSSTGGASIKTFFVGRCLMQLPGVYKRWNRAEQRARFEGHRFATIDLDQDQHQTDPRDAALASVRLDEIFDETDDAVRAMFELKQNGFALDEIAEMLTSAGIATTEGQVRTKMSRFRLATKGT